MRRAWLGVSLAALAVLLWHAAGVGMAGDYVDQIGRITAQDEALYANSAIHMAREGSWLTPMFMGRYALYKPPLLAWLAGASARVAGVSRLALRFPIALVCGFAIGLIFLWAAELRSWQAGLCAALLLASNHLWHVLGSLCMTDGLLAAFFIGAMYCVFADPWLESRAALWGFAASVAAAVMTKSVAGILPLAALGLYWLAAPRKYKPSFGRLCWAGALSGLLAAPWFVYQALAHGRWFWAEHFGVELLGYGAGAPPQAAHETHLLFYSMRMALLDPVLTAAVVVSLPGFFGALRKRSAAAVLLACWTAVVLGSAFGWQYRNVSYLLPMIPALAIVAVVYGPFATMRPAWWMPMVAGLAFVLKTMAPDAPWGISFQHGTVQPVAPIVSGYCRQERANELIVVGMDDDLYATVLPLPRVRYAIEGQPGPEGPYAMSFAQMGIVVTASQFDALDKWEPFFRQRLRDWGLDSDAPIGTLIVAQGAGQFRAMAAAHPDSDFLFPDSLRGAVVGDPSHVLVDAAPGHFLLLSRAGRRRGTTAWSCWM